MEERYGNTRAHAPLAGGVHRRQLRNAHTLAQFGHLVFSIARDRDHNSNNNKRCAPSHFPPVFFCGPWTMVVNGSVYDSLFLALGAPSALQSTTPRIGSNTSNQTRSGQRNNNTTQIPA
jgi:hypothetical protein